MTNDSLIINPDRGIQSDLHELIKELIKERETEYEIN